MKENEALTQIVNALSCQSFGMYCVIRLILIHLGKESTVFNELLETFDVHHDALLSLDGNEEIKSYVSDMTDDYNSYIELIEKRVLN